MQRAFSDGSVRRQSKHSDRNIATKHVITDCSLLGFQISSRRPASHACSRVTPYTKTKSNRGARSVEGEGTAVHPERCMPWILPFATAPKSLGCSLSHHPFGCLCCLTLRGSCG